MRAFAELYARLDATTKTNRKLAAMRDYFAAAPPEDAAWAIYFLSDRKLKRLVTATQLRNWGVQHSGVPDWLFDESYHAVGDLAEALALLLPPPERASDLPLHRCVEEYLLGLRGRPDAEQGERIAAAWQAMDANQRLVLNKLITGGFRVGVSHGLLVRAVAEQAGLEPDVVAHRMMGEWQPTPEFYRQLTAPEDTAAALGRPYPYFLAHPLEGDPAALGPVADWQAEWKWDGIRSQLLRREGTIFLWSRGEELVGERFPEIVAEAASFPDGTVIDGEILAWRDDAVLPFAELQKRITRKTVTKKLLADVPACFMAFDLLEWQGRDVRSTPLRERRALLAALLQSRPATSRIRLSPTVETATWEALARQREASRANLVEGLMLKRLDSPYGVGRERGPWWKWKIAPLTVDAVMVYAQLGHGRRASLYTDYTFAVWHAGELVPFAKAYSGLTDEEIRAVDRFVRRNTLEKFGPVRRVKPELVFEIAFEGIQRSTRHKSGIAVRFPRMLRQRTDKTPEQADTLEQLQALLPDRPEVAADEPQLFNPG